MAFAVPGGTRADKWGLAAVCAIATMGSTQLASALVFVAVQGSLVLFSPAATRWYADAIGMPFRDYATNLSPALLLPFTFPLAALAAAGIVAFAGPARRVPWPCWPV